MRQHLLSALTWAAAGAVVPAALLHFVGGQETHLSGEVHFWAVMLSAFAATGAAIALTAVGARRGDGRVVLVATAFSAMAAMLAVHGMATPGQITGPNGLGALTGGVTLPLGGAILALTAVPSLWRSLSISTLLWGQVVLLVSIVTVSVVGLVVPSAVPSVPATMSVPALALLAVGLAFFGIVFLRACRTWLLTRRAADLVVVVGIVWLGAALVPALTQSYLELGWWLGHAFEVIGIAFVGAVVAWDLHRTAQSRTLLGDLRAAQLVSAEEAFLGSHVRALVLGLQAKDVYTEGHTRRVALLAVELGEELGLPPHQLRALAAGALLHDIGKLSIPDEVLKKPGSLTPEELAVIREHPARGERLLGELGGFSPTVRRLVRAHHERLDGSGYPDGVGADSLELDVRILSVCDVYDALVSTRVYRGAWTHEAAMELITGEAGRTLDARCVQALARVFAREQAQAGAGADAPTTAPAAPTGAPQAAPLLPSIPTVYASDPGRIVRRP
jgi:HD domain-containing protein